MVIAKQKGTERRWFENNFSISEINTESPLDHVLYVLSQKAQKKSVVILKPDFFTRALVKAA